MAHTKALRLSLALLTAPALLCTASDPAEAKSHHSSPYTYQQTYGTALRLVKVDLGLKVTEQDPDWGYLLFEYTSRESGKRRSRGSFEFVRVRGDVKVALQLATMPSHHERVLIEKLRRKLTAEHGTPPSPKPKKREKKLDPEGDKKAPSSKAKKHAGGRKTGKSKSSG